jgi:diguanylate cyclase (GGDEF)-like protein
MISFLICIDRFGVVNDINWSVPAYIVPMRNSAFLDLFPDSEKEFVEILVEKSFKEDTLFQSERSLHLNHQTSNVNLCFLRVDEQLLVFAVEDAVSIDSDCRKEFLQMVHKFMYTIKAYFKSNAIHNNESVGYQFDKIQVLNNELVNTRRMLEKSNSQLNRLNQDLNNRLVKDALTGLVSRYQYRAEIDYLISTNPGSFGIFVFMDIDGFKGINDSLGHAAGDQYLVEFAERLKNLPIENAIKLRIAGDEFGLFVYGLDQIENATMEDLWNKIRTYVMEPPLELKGKNYRISISAGMAAYGVDTLEIYEIIEYADFAMYQAKESGKNGYRRFDKKEYELQKDIKYIKDL